jgi:uncharacterized protein (DUF58 family)
VKDERTRRLEAMLRTAAEKCEQWARESRSGGWSTHQVEANKQLAKEIYAVLGRG